MNVIKDVSTLTTIPDKTIMKLVQKMTYCICEGLEEDCLADTTLSDFDIGFGTLWIKHEGGEIKYKFIPNDAFNKAVCLTVSGKLNSLENSLNDNLAKKFLDVYKDICN